LQPLALALSLALLDPLPEFPPATVAEAWSQACEMRLTILRAERRFVHGVPADVREDVPTDDAEGVLGVESARHLRLRYPAAWFDAWERALDRSASFWRVAGWSLDRLRGGWGMASDWECLRQVEPLVHWQPVRPKPLRPNPCSR
jgi:hypothetical protein